MLRDLIRFRSLLRNLVAKDLKLKYRDSVLGVVWSLLNPLLMLAVYTLAFKFVMRVRVEHYPFFLLVGLLPWTFFAASLLMATRAITTNANLIKKVYFPRTILPIATVLFSLAQMLLGLAVFVPVLVLLSGAGFHWTMVLFVPLVTLHTLFTIGLALFVAGATVFFRDVAHLTEVFLPLAFWITPVAYPIAMVPDRVRALLEATPLAAFTVAYQDVLLWGHVPGPVVLGSVVLWTVAVFGAGHAFFRRCSPAFAEEV
jgi:lipopolysaccharide transport system permease protein